MTTTDMVCLCLLGTQAIATVVTIYYARKYYLLLSNMGKYINKLDQYRYDQVRRKIYGNTKT